MPVAAPLTGDAGCGWTFPDKRWPDRSALLAALEQRILNSVHSMKAPYAHTRRVNLKDAQGQSMAIVRHGMPYGNSQEVGLFLSPIAGRP